MKIQLNHKVIGQKRKGNLVFVHGILGYWRNFYSISQQFKEDYRCLLYDQRGHGDSPHKKPYTVENLAQDLKELIADLNMESVFLVGHSLGAYVSCLLAYEQNHLIKKLVMVDACPWPKEDSAVKIKNILKSLPDSFKDRSSAQAFFNQSVKDKCFSQEIAYWLMGSLKQASQDKKEIHFSFDKQGLLDLLPSVRQQDFPFYLKNIKCPTLFLRGENSSHFFKSDLEKTLKLNSLIQGVEVPQSRHWIHAEQPQKFVKYTRAFLQDKF